MTDKYVQVVMEEKYDKAKPDAFIYHPESLIDEK